MERLQSEDRPVEKDMVSHLECIDLRANQTVDDAIVDNLRTKFDIASQLTGDRLRSWL